MPKAHAIPPVFIGGCGRSGTTLLSDLLGCHSQLSPIYEPGFIMNVASLIFFDQETPAPRRLQTIADVVKSWIRDRENPKLHKKTYERYRHGLSNLRFSAPTLLRETDLLCRRLQTEPPLAPFRDYVATLFAEHAEQEGKPHWLAKVPRFVLITPLLKQAFPTMRFIHCVRDPRATIASMASRAWAPKALDEQIDYWRDSVQKGVQFIERFPKDGIEIRYEDLRDDPAAMLGRLFQWLSIADETASILPAYERDFPIARDSSGPGSTLPARSRQQIERQLGSLMSRYGYES